MKLKLSKTKLVMAFLFLGFVVIVRYAMRDLELDIDILRDELLNMPGMVMQNMRLSREISGDIWKISIPYIERRDSLVSIRSLDIRREIKRGGEWYFFGREGIYSQDEQVAVFNGINGTLVFGEGVQTATDNRVMNLESPRVSWMASRDELVFPRGLSLYDQEYLIHAETASLDRDGVILFDNGGVVQWTKPIDWDAGINPEDLELDLDLELDY